MYYKNSVVIIYHIQHLEYYSNIQNKNIYWKR